MIVEQLRYDILYAMKHKGIYDEEAVRTEFLGTARFVMGEIKKVEVSDNSHPLSDGKVIRVLSTLKKSWMKSIEDLRCSSRNDKEALIRKTSAEIAVVDKYLPVGPSEAEIREKVEGSLSELGLMSPVSRKSFGKVMKKTMISLFSPDGKKVRDIVEEYFEPNV
ncbi:MAG: GatB/YqeY domain-containing protein [bacterium]|nr:GatB/YqeY domain-containing protein [bacterium]